MNTTSPIRPYHPIPSSSPGYPAVTYRTYVILAFLRNLHLPSPITSPSLTSQILPLLPLILSSNVLTISWEWSNHLTPLSTLQNPISPKTLSEIFRRSYINGASSFLFSLLGSISTSTYLAYATPCSSESRMYYTWTAAFGVLHLFPFSAIIVRYVNRACDGSGKLKSEVEVKEALNSWLRVNRYRMWMDFAGMCCAVMAVVKQE